jgi:hypothetical protein
MEIEVLFHVILSTVLTRIKPPFAIESSRVHLNY